MALPPRAPAPSAAQNIDKVGYQRELNWRGPTADESSTANGPARRLRSRVPEQIQARNVQHETESVAHFVQHGEGDPPHPYEISLAYFTDTFHDVRPVLVMRGARRT